ncbi:hypothetical protein MYAER_3946 [Microcystis aeruginosa NIES-2549]|uniref:Uncharacterized protein n=1 Tax=Microcystis aeruginosa NIES-2549 TaxID=1641812 RepID=A0A0F6U768_MICAE|nr:hypothetical protein MYAER_3946 [Microcystis aeruginosa NIES-2549]
MLLLKKCKELAKMGLTLSITPNYRPNKAKKSVNLREL